MYNDRHGCNGQETLLDRCSGESTAGDALWRRWNNRAQGTKCRLFVQSLRFVFLQELTSGDEGLYRCLAFNGNGTAVAPEISLKLACALCRTILPLLGREITCRFDAFRRGEPKNVHSAAGSTAQGVMQCAADGARSARFVDIEIGR